MDGLDSFLPFSILYATALHYRSSRYLIEKLQRPKSSIRYKQIKNHFIGYDAYFGAYGDLVAFQSCPTPKLSKKEVTATKINTVPAHFMLDNTLH